VRKVRLAIIIFFIISLSALSVNAQSCVVPPSELVSWWTGDVDATDFQGTNDGIVTGSATAGVPGKVDEAFNFPGTGAVSIPSDTSLDIESTITVDAWIKPVFTGRPRDGATDSDVIYSLDISSAFHGQHQLSVLMDPAGFGGAPLGTPQVALIINGASTVLTSTSVVPDDDEFHHLAYTYDGEIIRLYLDGVETDTLLASGAMDTENSGAFIGHRVFTARDSLADIDEVELFDRALTQPEILAIFNAGSAGKCKEAAEGCGDGILEEEEECDDGNTEKGDGCNEFCELEAGPEEIKFNFGIASNLLHNKILFLFNVVKEAFFQLELKELEVNVAHNACKDVIFDLRVNKEKFRYGKENEFDALLRKLIVIYEENPFKYEGIDVETADDFLFAAETWNDLEEFDKAVACKCKAYKVLNEQEDPIECEDSPINCDVEEFETCPQECSECDCTLSGEVLPIEPGQLCED